MAKKLSTVTEDKTVKTLNLEGTEVITEGSKMDPEQTEPSEMIFWATLATEGKYPTKIDGVEVSMKIDTAYKNIITKPIENPFLPSVNEDGVFLPGKSSHKDEQSGEWQEDAQLIQTAVVISKGQDVKNSKLKPGAVVQYYSRTARPVPFDVYQFEATSEANILAIYSIATK